MTTIREDFEQWAKERGHPLCDAIPKYGPASSMSETTLRFSDIAWEAYQAATERAAAVCADVDEPAWYGFECPYSFQDGKVACIAAIRAQTGGEG